MEKEGVIARSIKSWAQHVDPPTKKLVLQSSGRFLEPLSCCSRHSARRVALFLKAPEVSLSRTVQYRPVRYDTVITRNPAQQFQKGRSVVTNTLCTKSRLSVVGALPVAWGTAVKARIKLLDPHPSFGCHPRKKAVAGWHRLRSSGRVQRPGSQRVCATSTLLGPYHDDDRC